MVFLTFSSRKSTFVDSFTKINTSSFYGRARLAAWAGMGWTGWAGLADWLLGWLDAGSFGIKSRLGDGRWSLNRDLESQGHKVIKSRVLVLILLIPGAKTRKLRPRSSRTNFHLYLIRI